jgi:L-ascorbate metabolism protein UlaG (beta-lactamase superfamily)
MVEESKSSTAATRCGMVTGTTLLELMDRFDAAFLPINGFRQVEGRFLDSGVPMSLTPEQAVAAAAILGVRLVVPIHYGSTWDKNYSEVTDPEANFLRAASVRGVSAKVLAPGEYLEL